MKKLACLVAVAAMFLMALPQSLAAQKPSKVGDAIVDFQLKSLEGKLVKTAKERKDKVLVLKFGATSCPPCTYQIPHLNKVVKEYAKKPVVVIDVDIREPAARVKAHNRRHRTNYVTLLDSNAKVAIKYGVRYIPLVIVADKKGKILYRGYFTPFNVLKRLIDGALKEKTEEKEGA